MHQEGDEVDVGRLHAWQQGIGWQAGGGSHLRAEFCCLECLRGRPGRGQLRADTAEGSGEKTTEHRLTGCRAAPGQCRAVHMAAKRWLMELDTVQLSAELHMWRQGTAHPAPVRALLSRGEPNSAQTRCHSTAVWGTGCAGLRAGRRGAESSEWGAGPSRCWQSEACKLMAAGS